MKNLTLVILLFLSICIYSQTEINPNGYNKLYYPSGSIQSEGLLVNGQPDGLWKTYYPTGVLKSIGKRENNKLDSVWVFFSIKGDTIKKLNYLNGQKNGFQYNYYTDNVEKEYVGNIKSKELFINNKKQGSSFQYYKSGKLQLESEYKNNLKEGKEIEYAPDGRIVTLYYYRKGSLVERKKINRFKNNERSGTWQTFYSNGKVKTETNYANGQIDGYYKEYDKAGSLNLTLEYDKGVVVKTIEEESFAIEEREEKDSKGNLISSGYYRANKPVGIHKTFNHDNGKIIASIYNNNSELLAKGYVDEEGRRNGLWEVYYSSGKLKAKGRYTNNKRSGKWYFFYEGGNNEQVGEFDNGLYNGSWTWYYESGDIWREENYFRGKEEGEFVEYTKNGEILIKGDYIEGEREGFWIVNDNDIVQKGAYVGGLRDGKWQYLYDDGSLRFEGNYIQGNENGKHRYYYPNGQLEEEQIYNSGIKVKHWKKYDEFGNLIITISYVNNLEYRINGVKVDLSDDNFTIMQ